jgi:hypothetical protein
LRLYDRKCDATTSSSLARGGEGGGNAWPRRSVHRTSAFLLLEWRARRVRPSRKRKTGGTRSREPGKARYNTKEGWREQAGQGSIAPPHGTTTWVAITKFLPARGRCFGCGFGEDFGESRAPRRPLARVAHFLTRKLRAVIRARRTKRCITCTAERGVDPTEPEASHARIRTLPVSRTKGRIPTAARRLRRDGVEARFPRARWA